MKLVLQLNKGLSWADKAVFHHEPAKQTVPSKLVAQKHPSNATKENVHRLANKPNILAEQPKDFIKRLGIEDVMYNAPHNLDQKKS